MQINKQYAQTRYNLTKTTGRTPKYILVHNTATEASAESNCKYFGSGNRNSSADFFIDRNGAIYQFNPDLRVYYSWHCGDGAGRYGITNQNSIGIECVSAGTEFTQAQKDSLRELIASLRSQFGIPAANVKRHYDASRKNCPAFYAGDTNARWNQLHSYITEEAEVITDQDLIRLRDAVWGKPMKLKHGNTTLTAEDIHLWNEYNTAATYSALAAIQQAEREIKEIRQEVLRTDDGGTGDKTSGREFNRVCWIDMRLRNLVDYTLPKLEASLNEIKKNTQK